MRERLRLAAGVACIAGLVLLPAVAGRITVTAGLLVVGWAAILALLLGAAELLPAAQATRTATEPVGKRGARTNPLPAETAPDVPPGPRFDATDWALLTFIVLSLLPLTVSVYRFASLVYGIKVLAAGLLFWVARYGLREEAWRRRLLWALTAGGAVASIWGLREYVRTVWFLGDVQWRIFGSFYNPNCLAGYLLLTALPAAALLFGVQTRRAATSLAPVARSGRKREMAVEAETVPARYPEIAASFALGLMVVALLLTGSKAAFAAFLVGMVIFGMVAAGCATRTRLLRGLVLAGVGVMILAALALPPLRVRLMSAFGGQSNSAQFRAYTWQSTLAMIRERPLLGFGGGTFEHAFPRFAIAGFTRQAHQSFLQIAAETGVPSLLAGLVWGALLLAGLWRRAQSAASGLLERLAAAAVLAAVIASAVQELADYAWYVPAIGASFFALAGVGLGTTRRAEEASVHPVTAPSGARRALGRPGVVALALSALLLLTVLPLAVGESLASLGDRLAAAQDYPAAAAAYERATHWDPWQARLQVQRSKVLEAIAGPDPGGLARAVQARLAAIRQQPTEALNYVALSRLYLGAGDKQSAVNAAREALRWYPRYPRGLVQLAAAQEAAGDRAGALATYRQLAALYATPVGQCPAIEGMGLETAYAAAWIALAAEARRTGREAEATRLEAQAATMLAGALDADRGVRTQTGGAVDLSLGRSSENESLAHLLLAQLARLRGPAARYREAQLTAALGDTAETQRVLSGVLAGLGDHPAGEAARLQVWAMLQEGREEMSGDRKEEGRERVAKGLALADRLPPYAPRGEAWWGAEDENQLSALREWARGALATPTTQ